MKRVKKPEIIGLIFCCVLVLFGCTKKEDPPVAPTVISISSLSAAVGDTVILSGTNFSSVASGNTVKFNNITVTVIQASSTQLTVVIPPGLISGSVAVTVVVNGQIANYSFSFTKSGKVSTLAGAVIENGYVDAVGVNARFWTLTGLIVDATGNLIVTDKSNGRIRKITPDGVVTTIAGSGQLSFQDGPAMSASFFVPLCIVKDPSGNLYVGDGFAGTCKIRKITPVGNVSTVQGNFYELKGMAVDAGGNIFATESLQHFIYKIDPNGAVSTFAGIKNSSGKTDGTGTAAKFAEPTGITSDAAGNFYITDRLNNVIRKMTPGGGVTTYAGSGSPAYGDGSAATSKFLYPTGIASDVSGNLYVIDQSHKVIRKITPAGEVTTVAGLPSSTGAKDGNTSVATFNFLNAIAVDPSGNLYVADGSAVRKVSF